MPDAIEIYLDRVMRHARLAPLDERRVRSELRDHLHELAAARAADCQETKEILAMLEEEFGDPKSVGDSIASAKGKFRTYLKRKATKVAVAAAVLLVLGLGIRASVAEVFRVPGNSVSPILVPGSRCVVYKLASQYQPQDVIVYKPAENPRLRYVAIVKESDPATGNLRVTRNGGVELLVPRDAVVGRVFLSTR